MSTDVDHGRALAREEKWCHEPAEVEDRHEIGLDDRRQLFERLILEKSVVTYPRVVDQYVEPSESSRDRLGERDAMARRGNVSCEGEGSRPVGEQFEPVRAPGCHDDLGTSPA